ncbi:MAG TPA: class I SAM-dependent methyltransferase [Methanosarcinales archaeon]|nr:class I SAM-dependent methyltransferase [Methanosarcinales archaeon]
MTKTYKIKSRYNRYAYFYDLLEAPVEFLVFGKWRKSILENLKGRILEVGIGTGKNLKYYPDGGSIIGIDFSEKMLEKAKPKANDEDKVSLIRMDGQKLGFNSNIFDYIITTFVLCSIPDPIVALKEMKRVCKINGKIIMLEHVKSKNQLIAMVSEILNPITLFLFGFYVNRDTIENIKNAGLNIIEEKNLALKDVFKLIKVMQI